MPENSVTVRVPGTTSNIGPGFDCMGIALALHNRITVTRHEEGAAVSPPHAMVSECSRIFFRRTSVPSFPFSWQVTGNVPVSRGLGSSVTIRLGILAALNELSGNPLSMDGLFALCSDIEGHPDNAGPAAFGGFVLTGSGGESFRFEVDPSLRFVLLVPELEVSTDHARRVLPPQIPHREAVLNVRNACIITAAFALREYGKLRDAMDDYLHQLYRAHLVPGLFGVIEAGTSAGALGGFLSGSGSVICCLTHSGNEDAIAAAMLNAWPGPSPASTLVVSADNRGTERIPGGSS